MVRKLIWLIPLLALALLPSSAAGAQVSDVNSHLRVAMLASDVQAVSVTLQDGRTVLSNLTPNSISEYMLYYVNRSTVLRFGITPLQGISTTMDKTVFTLPGHYYTLAVVGSYSDGLLDAVLIDETATCDRWLAQGSCVITVNNIIGSPPLLITADNAQGEQVASYREVVANGIPAGNYGHLVIRDASQPDVAVFDLGSGFFERDVVYFQGLLGSYPGRAFFDYNIGVVRRVPVDMMTFLRGFTADLGLSDAQNIYSFENIVALLEQTGFDTLLSNQQIGLTVFAPTDQAVLDVPADIYQCAIDNPMAMRTLVLNHVMTGVFTSDDLVSGGVRQTMAGTMLSFAPAELGFFINNSVRVSTSQGYTTANGNVYPVDTVLIPDNFQAQYCEVG